MYLKTKRTLWAALVLVGVAALYELVLLAGLSWIGPQLVLVGHLLVALIAWFMGIRSGLLLAGAVIVLTYYTMPHFVEVQSPRMRAQGVVSALVLLSIAVVVGWIGLLYRRLQETQKKLIQEHQKTELLLRNLIPEQVMQQVRHGEVLVARNFFETTILFCDLVGLAELAKIWSKEQWHHLFSAISTEINAEAQRLGIGQIKVIGDGYMMAGFSEHHPHHAELMAQFALSILRVVKAANAREYCELKPRVGMHSGPVMTASVGDNRFALDLWGDTVNLASRLESQGIPGKVHLSEEMFRLINHRFYCVSAGNTHLKNYGERRTYYLEGIFEKT